MTIMKAISIRSPWWAWILYGGKNIENRDWYHRYRGPVLIHASKFWRDEEIKLDNGSARMMAKDAGRQGLGGTGGMFTFSDMQQRLGCIVGVADIVDCVSLHPSPWFVGKFGFVLENVRPIKQPFAVKGALGFFPVDVSPDQLL